MSKWLEPPEVAVPEDLQAYLGGHPLVTQVLVKRGYSSIETVQAFLDPNYYSPSSPFELPGMEQAVTRLEQSIRKQESICIWGDFDVDGQTATTVLVSALQDLGAKVTYYIPNRANESHGIHIAGLNKLVEQGIKLVVTCDTGISSHATLTYAQRKHLDIIVTDHHSLPDKLPDALALVNPQMLPDIHPLYTLPGVGVAFKLVEALYQRLAESSTENLDSYLDLVALGIVADVAVQTGETRYLLQRGLQTLRNTRRPGLQIMMELAELNPLHITEDHIGFVLAPRLNALGRLDDANPVVELLTTDNEGRARMLAYQLEGLNAQRKALTDQVFQGAMAQIEQDPSLLNYAALVLSHPSWPGGVVGIVASRLVNRFNKPVVLIVGNPVQTEPGSGRGSARSVSGINITAAISQCQQESNLLDSFGGHPLAAGLSLPAARIPEFRRLLSRTIQKMVGERSLEPVLPIDGYLSLADLSLSLVEDLERLAPFGAGNPPLTLASRALKIQSHSLIGRGGEHLQLIVEDESGAAQKILWWQGAGWPLPEGSFDLAYTVHASTYRGQKDVQATWLEARQLEIPSTELLGGPLSFEVVDLRDQEYAQSNLEKLVDSHIQAGHEVQIWCEAETKTTTVAYLNTRSLFRDRYSLQPCHALVIWTSPPGRAELQAALASTHPAVVYLIGFNPPTAKPEAFLKYLAGLVKYTLHAKDGRTSIAALAAATAQQHGAVQLGLACLQERGLLTNSSPETEENIDGELWLKAGSATGLETQTPVNESGDGAANGAAKAVLGITAGAVTPASVKLKSILDESAADAAANGTAKAVPGITAGAVTPASVKLKSILDESAADAAANGTAKAMLGITTGAVTPASVKLKSILDESAADAAANGTAKAVLGITAGAVTPASVKLKSILDESAADAAANGTALAVPGITTGAVTPASVKLKSILDESAADAAANGTALAVLGITSGAVTPASVKLKSILDESAAYRAFFSRAKADTLLAP